MAVLGKHASEVNLNKTAAAFADDLIEQGMVNWGGFAWDSDDDDDLLDYDLASNGDHDVQTHYPFGKNGEVYVKALLAAEKEGGAIGSYAAQLSIRSLRRKNSRISRRKAHLLREGMPAPCRAGLATRKISAGV